MSKENKKPSWLHPVKRLKYEGAMTTYRELQARLLTPEEVSKWDVELPPSWREQPLSWLLTSLGIKKLPPGSGHGFVQSPYADVYTRVYGVQPISDLPKYRTMIRNSPTIQAAIELQVTMAIGKGFSIQHPSKEIRVWLERVVDEINLLETMLVLAHDMLGYGNAYGEILWDDREESPAEQVYEYNGAHLTRKELEKFKIEKDFQAVKSVPTKLTINEKNEFQEVPISADGQPRPFVAQTIGKGAKAKRVLGIKPLDPVYLRIRRDSWGNIYGYLQFMAFPPALIDNDSMIHIRYRPKSWGFESAYGTSLLMSLIKNQDLLNMFENDAAVWVHGRAVPPLIVKGGGDPLHPYSLLSDQKIIAFNEGELHIDTIENFAKYEGLDENVKGGVDQKLVPNKDIFVPSFTSENKVVLKRVKAIIRHKYLGDNYRIKTRFGKNIDVTKGHSVFKWETKYKYPFMEGNKGKIVPCKVDELKLGDYIAVIRKLPVIEKNLTEIKISDLFEDKWELLVYYTDEQWKSFGLDKIIRKHVGINQRTKFNTKELQAYETIRNLLKERYKAYKRALGRMRDYRRLEYPIYEKLHKLINLPMGSLSSKHKRKKELLGSAIKISDDFLWLLGMFIAEGSQQGTKIKWGTDDLNIQKIFEILKRLSFNPTVTPYKKIPKYKGKFGSQSPNVYIYSQIFALILKRLGFDTKTKRIPSWIIQLPLSRLKFFLGGLYDGDGNHGSKYRTRFCYSTSRKDLADDLSYLLLRFGVLSAIKEVKTEFDTLDYEVSATVINTDFLDWDIKVVQPPKPSCSSHYKIGDLALVKIRDIEKLHKKTEWVYDFEVEETENFVGGLGICLHNTTSQMQDLMNKLKERVAASMLFVKSDVEITELQGAARALNIQWWIDYLMQRRYEALGVPPILMGLPEGANRATSEVVFQDFIVRLQLIQEFIADPIETQVLYPLIKANFGATMKDEDGKEIPMPKPKIKWKPIVEEDRNMRSQRLIQGLQAGALSINEYRMAVGFDELEDPKYNEVRGTPALPFRNPLPGNEPSPEERTVPQWAKPPPEGVPKKEEKLTAEQSFRVKKLRLLINQEQFKNELLGVVKGAKFDFRQGEKTVKQIKGEAMERAKKVINHYVSDTYLYGKLDASVMGVLKKEFVEEDLALKKEDLPKVAELKKKFTEDFKNILDDLVIAESKGMLDAD